MTGPNASIHRSLRAFAEAVTAKTARVPAGAPEDRLRAPFEILMTEAAAAFGWEVVCAGETPLPDRLGRPDFAVHRNGLLAGYVELKAPGKGVDAGRFKGRDRAQFKRFSNVPNMLYGDGNEWALYRGKKRVGAVVRLSGDVTADGSEAVAAADALPADIKADADERALAAARDAIKQVQILYATEVVSLLGISVGFSDNDGDS